MKDYLKLSFSWLENTETLSDAEFRRLIIAAVAYCRDEREPSLQGGERHVWPTLKKDIDKERAVSAKRSQSGKRGGRPRLEHEEKQGGQLLSQKSKQKQNGGLLSEEKESPRSPSSSPPTPPVITPPIAPQKKKKPPVSPAEAGEGVFAAYAAGDLELLAALRDFDEMRTKIKKPMTDRARRQLCVRLDKLASHAGGKVELLNEAVLHCWQSVYVPDGCFGDRRKEDGRGTTGSANPANPAGTAGSRWALKSDL